jgi:hypothetical protein
MGRKVIGQRGYVALRREEVYSYRGGLGSDGLIPGSLCLAAVSTTLVGRACGLLFFRVAEMPTMRRCQLAIPVCSMEVASAIRYSKVEDGYRRRCCVHLCSKRLPASYA